MGIAATQAGCLAALLAATGWTMRLAIADLLARQNQPASTRLTMRWMPLNGAYAAQLADEIYASDPACGHGHCSQQSCSN